MPNYDPNNQDSWVQPVEGSNTGQQSWSTQQGAQTGQEPWSTQGGGQMGRDQAASQQGNTYPSTPSSGQTGQGGLLGGPVHAVRQDVQQQINGLIDHYASQVPGGHTFTPEAKQAVSGILDNLQNQLESQVQSRVSGMGGGLGNRVGGSLFGSEPNNEGGQGGQL